MHWITSSDKSSGENVFAALGVIDGNIEIPGFFSTDG